MQDPQERPLVLITGASGFIGSRLSQFLAARYRVVGLDLKRPQNLKGLHDGIEINLTSDESVRSALAQVRSRHGERIASVIHLAAYFDLTGEPNPKYEEITVRGTERLLRELKKHAVEQFVFASTLLVHAPGRRGQPINEDWPLDPKFPYRASKIRTEQLLRDQHGSIPLVITRLAGVYDDEGHAAFLAHQIARIYERKLNSRVYPGALDSGQPFLHLDDLCEAMARLVERRGNLPAELPLLLAEPETASFRALQDAIGQAIHGESWPTLKIPRAVAKAGAVAETKVLDVDPFIRPWMVDVSSDHYEVDIGRARQWLDWTPRRRLLDTLPSITAALQRDPKGWYRSNHLNPAVVADKAPEVLGDEHAAVDMGTMPQHMEQMRQMHFQVLWAHYLNLLLGAWLVAAPFAFGAFDPQPFSEAVQRVTAERGLGDPAQRLALLGWSDIFSGLFLMLFASLSLSPRFAWAQWGSAAVGGWLLLAPLVFWSPSAAMYNNDLLVGALVIAFAVLVPMMPGMNHAAMMDSSDLPPGWTYSPSTYLQRLPMIALGFIGFLIARQLAAYQLGHVDGVWEPFFQGEGGRNGTEQIITSKVSKAWPVADAGLGAVTYLLEVLMGTMGDRRRWRTMPWMVAAFGVVVVPLGVVSIYFIIIQPIVIGTYCTLCLLAALAMLVMIPYTLDELVAMGQYMVQSHRRGQGLLRTFFQGGACPGAGKDESAGFDAPLRQALRSAVRGVNLPWNLLACAVLGAALMLTRLLFGTEGAMADSDHLVGALIVTMSVMAFAEVGRPLRYLNLPLAAWLLIAPWVLDGAPLGGALVSAGVGLAVIALSLSRGPRSAEHYGNWDRFIV